MIIIILDDSARIFFKKSKYLSYLIIFIVFCAYDNMKQSALMKNNLNSLVIPQGLIDLLIENSLSRERLSRMTIDELAFLLSIDNEAAKLILNALTNSSKYMIHDMRELG